jgi:pre-rRNA-processing protein RIX1
MIAEIPIAVILSLLEQPKPEEVQYVLKSLYLSQSTVSKASKSEINHLTSRIGNLLNSNDDHSKWYGCHLVQVIATNPIILSTSGQNYIVSLLKIINDSKTIPVNLKNASLALNTVMKGIRGKPVLTREILTPNLPNIISSLIEKLEKDIVTILPILQTLTLKNTTTFKPFLSKFEAKLIKLLGKENFGTFDKSLQKQVSTCFAYTNLVSQNHQQQQQSGHAIQALPDDQWRVKIFQILSELSSVIEIYDNLIELKEEADLVELLALLSSKYSDSKNFIFPFLKIDLSRPITILSISKRINVLIQLLIAFITSPTPFPLRIPLGTIVNAGNLLSSLSLNYIPFKRELSRDEDIKKIISNDVTNSQSIGAELIYEITLNYKRLVLPHLKSILSCLEVAIPVEKTKLKANSKVIKVDEEFALSIESELLQVIQSSVELFKIADGVTEYDLVNKLIDVSILLLKKRKPLDGLLDKQENKHQEQTNQQKNKKNKKRSKDATPLSDILSHSALFELEPPSHTISVILNLFEIILKKFTKVSINSRLKVVKYIISQSVKQTSNNGYINVQLVRLLETIVLFPGEGEVYSFLPIIKRLLPNSEKLSLLTNPRFPPLDVKYKVKKQDISQIEEDYDEEEEEEDDSVIIEESKEEEAQQDFLKDFKGQDEPASPSKKEAVFKTDEEIKTLEFAKPAVEVQIQEETVVEVGPASRTRSLEKDEDAPSKRIKIDGKSEVSAKEVKIVDDDAYDGLNSSDGEFEIPDIEVDSDEE